MRFNQGKLSVSLFELLSKKICAMCVRKIDGCEPGGKWCDFGEEMQDLKASCGYMAEDVSYYQKLVTTPPEDFSD